MADILQPVFDPSYRWITCEPDTAPGSQLFAIWDVRPKLCRDEDGFISSDQAQLRFGELLSSHLFVLPSVRSKHAVWERRDDRWVRVPLRGYR